VGLKVHPVSTGLVFWKKAVYRLSGEVCGAASKKRGGEVNVRYDPGGFGTW